MSKQFTKKTLIVSAPIAPMCRQLAAKFPSGNGMWVTALSASGEAPATHYISAGKIWTEFAMMVASPEALSAGAGIDLDQAAAILSQCDVSQDAGMATMARMGLTFADLIDLNTATQEELEAAPGIGASKALAIIAGRPWASVDDLVSVSGIGAASIPDLSNWYKV